MVQSWAHALRTPDMDGVAQQTWLLAQSSGPSQARSTIPLHVVVHAGIMVVTQQCWVVVSQDWAPQVTRLGVALASIAEGRGPPSSGVGPGPSATFASGRAASARDPLSLGPSADELVPSAHPLTKRRAIASPNRLRMSPPAKGACQHGMCQPRKGPTGSQ